MMTNKPKFDRVSQIFADKIIELSDSLQAIRKELEEGNPSQADVIRLRDRAYEATSEYNCDYY